MSEPPRCALAITGATVLEGAPDWRVRHGCDVVVHDGHFAAIGPDAASGFAVQRRIDGRTLLVLPGLVNAHTHSTEALARGLADGATLATWIQAVWRKLDAIDPEIITLGVHLAAAEMLHGGVTAAVDHFRQTPMRAEAIDAAARAWDTTGMRATLAPMMRDLGIPPWVPATRHDQCSIAAQVALCEAAASRWHHRNARVRIGLGPSAPTRCTDDLLLALDAVAKRHDLALHMHVDEIQDDTRTAHAQHGMTSVARLERLGLLGPRLSIAHAVWVTDGDLDAIARSGTTIVHNPLSNLRLGSGRAPLERMLARGIAVAIGTDGAASNDTQSVLEATKLATLLPRIAGAGPEAWPSAGTALTMATAAGARAFAMGAGAIRVGEPADCVAFDAGALPLVPLHDAVTQVVFAGASLHARHVVIDGQVVVYDGSITTFDEAAVVAAATAWHAHAAPA